MRNGASHTARPAELRILPNYASCQTPRPAIRRANGANGGRQYAGRHGPRSARSPAVCVLWQYASFGSMRRWRLAPCGLRR